MEFDFEPQWQEEVEFGKLALRLYVACRPNMSIELEFTALSVDGKPVSPIKPQQLPQGVAVLLGSFTTGQKLSVAWRFHTQIITQPTEVVVGILRSPGSGRTILEELTIDAFKDYAGAATVVA